MVRLLLHFGLFFFFLPPKSQPKSYSTSAKILAHNRNGGSDSATGVRALKPWGKGSQRCQDRSINQNIDLNIIIDLTPSGASLDSPGARPNDRECCFRRTPWSLAMQVIGPKPAGPCVLGDGWRVPSCSPLGTTGSRIWPWESGRVAERNGRVGMARDGPESKSASSSITLPGVISAAGARLHFSEGLLLAIANKIRF